jgi:hypothetical protein
VSLLRIAILGGSMKGFPTKNGFMKGFPTKNGFMKGFPTKNGFRGIIADKKWIFGIIADKKWISWNNFRQKMDFAKFLRGYDFMDLKS